MTSQSHVVEGVLGGAITDVAGIEVGHFTDPRRPTGCTVVLTGPGAVAGVDVRGGAPGTRETDLLSPTNIIEAVHAVLLTGGSAFGLDAASGVVRWLEEHDIGHPVGPTRVPIVPAAVLFDLWVGDHRIRPDAQAGYAACEAAGTGPVAEGSIGAGAGAIVGKLRGVSRAMKGGIGTASARFGEFTVGAIVAVNAMGDVIDPRCARIIAGARSEDGRVIEGVTEGILAGVAPVRVPMGSATTIGVIATDARLTKVQAQKLAQMGHDGLARTIDPIHTMTDGDTLFALGTGRKGGEADLLVLGALAARVVASAVLRAVLHASAIVNSNLPAIPTASDFGNRLPS